MNLAEAYALKKRECSDLQRENQSLQDIINGLLAGTYTDPEKIAHLAKITRLTRELREKERIIERYRILYDDAKKRLSDLAYEYSVLDEKNRIQQWQIDCLQGKSSDRSRTAKEEADAKIKALSDTVAKLSSLLDRDGTNTGTPTSQTALNKKKVIPNSREKTGRSRGGQPGHKKHVMPAFSDDELTETVIHEMATCPECGGTLTEVDETPKDELDYEVIVKKKRHIFKRYVCDLCGKVVRTADPHLRAENQYGPNIQATALALMDVGFVSLNRTRSLLGGLLPGSVPISEGYLAKLQKRHAGNLEAFTEEVRCACIEADILYWDETVVFVDTARACIRFYGNEQIALYTAHMKKDLKGIMEDDVLPCLSPATTVMHDHNLVNYNDIFRFKNIECLQHLERDLTKIWDSSHHEWAASLKKLIMTTIHDRKNLIASGVDHFDSSTVVDFMNRYDSLLKSGYKEYFKSPKAFYSREENALLVRLERYRENYTEWVRNFSVPTTNNLAERSLRFIKSKSKISGQFQNIEFAKHFAALQTYIETCKRHNVNQYDAMLRLTGGVPYSLLELRALYSE